MDNHLERLIAGSLVSLSTLHAAAEIVRRRADRARGIDPSEEESPPAARKHLRVTVRELEDLAFRLGALQSEVLVSVDELSRAVANMDSLLVLNRIAQLLEDVHRRLLSLYPEIDEAVIEQARQMAAACRSAVAQDGEIASDDLFDLTTRIRDTSF